MGYATNSTQHSVGYSNNDKGSNYTPSCDQHGKGGKPGNPGDNGYGNKGGYSFGGSGFGGFGW